MILKRRSYRRSCIVVVQRAATCLRLNVREFQIAEQTFGLGGLSVNIQKIKIGLSFRIQEHWIGFHFKTIVHWVRLGLSAQTSYGTGGGGR